MVYKREIVILELILSPFPSHHCLWHPLSFAFFVTVEKVLVLSCGT